MLTYLTRVAVPSQAAQARQIQAMAQAFHQVLGSDFRLITGAGVEGVPPVTPYVWQKLPVYRYQSLRQLQTILAGALQWIGNRRQLFYTRDLAVAFALGQLGARTLYEAHQSLKGGIQQRMLRAMRTRPNFGLVAISQALADHFEHEHAMPAERMLVAHDGVFLAAYPPITTSARLAWRHHMGIPDDALVVLHTGSLYKGGAELFGRVLEAAGPRTYLVQVGGKSQEHQAWQRHYGETLGQRLRFVPHVPHEKIPEFQCSADLLLYLNTRASPLYWCTSPLKLFEYMASGVPIVGSSIGSVAEVLHENNAFCFDPDVKDSLEQALRHASQDPIEAARRAARARQDVEQHYTWESRIDRILHFARSRKLL